MISRYASSDGYAAEGPGTAALSQIQGTGEEGGCGICIVDHFKVVIYEVPLVPSVSRRSSAHSQPCSKQGPFHPHLLSISMPTPHLTSHVLHITSSPYPPRLSHPCKQLPNHIPTPPHIPLPSARLGKQPPALPRERGSLRARDPPSGVQIAFRA